MMNRFEVLRILILKIQTSQKNQYPSHFYLNRYLQNMDKTKPNNFLRYLLYKTAAYIAKIK